MNDEVDEQWHEDEPEAGQTEERATVESAIDEEHAYLRSRFARSSRRRQLRRGIRRHVTEDGGGMHPDTCSGRPGALFVSPWATRRMSTFLIVDAAHEFI
jgi:hypothetical protein